MLLQKRNAKKGHIPKAAKQESPMQRFLPQGGKSKEDLQLQGKGDQEGHCVPGGQ